MRPKIVLVGDRGVAKNKIMKTISEDMDLEILRSFTTKQTKEPHYIVIPQNEIATIPSRILVTEFFGNTYFTTKHNLLIADIMAISQDCLDELMDYVSCHIIYLYRESNKGTFTDYDEAINVDAFTYEELINKVKQSINEVYYKYKPYMK